MGFVLFCILALLSPHVTHFAHGNSSNATIRLADGSSTCEGRVEVFYNGSWGTVCDDLWDDTDAAVVCRILGLDSSNGSAPLAAASYGEGSGEIVLDNVQCVGTETDLFSCPSNGPLNHNCVHSEDAGVLCCNTQSLRICLADGSSSNEGRVEAFFNGQWGTVCDDRWDLNDANVVCQSLGLGPALEAVSNAGFGKGTGIIVLDNVGCTGNETNIFDCFHSGLGIHNCVHEEDAGVRCSRNYSDSSSSMCPTTQSQATTQSQSTTQVSTKTTLSLQPHTTTEAPTTTQTTATPQSQTTTQTTATTPAQTTTQTTTTTPAQTTTQTTATTPARTSVSTTLTKDTFRRSKIFRRVAIDKALSNAYSSHQVVSVISCGQLCLADESCKYFTYIEHKRECLLGQSLTTTELLNGASTYSC